MTSDIKAEDIRATYETKDPNEAKRYTDLGWLLIDTYTVGPEKFYILAWAKEGEPSRP